jgi:hypothetical protein
MNIIRSIDIYYFRSVYHIRLSNLQGLNVLSGRNDSGKSNILKAMNLFFNGQTDWQTDLDFYYRDFSSQRLEQVRKESIKGKQFISVAIEFRRPNAYQGSLPEVFRVVRVWHRYGSVPAESNNLESLEKRGRLPSSLETARRFLPIFLNRVHFEYVPAVKDRLYFKYLLARLQKSLLDIPMGADTGILKTADNLAEHVQNKIVRLQEDFRRATSIDSFVVPPAELGSLFQSFLVSTESGKGHKIPLDLRGDGIQARYVPSVLRYICENSNDFFIWGFEEPENSLEYSHVVELVKDFQNVYSKVAQVFLTTHSPALTGIRSDDTTCFRVYQDAKGLSNVGAIWPESRSAEERSKLNIEMGFQKLAEDKHTEYVSLLERSKILQNELDSIEEEARQAKKPLVLVEGKQDKTILETAWMKCVSGKECPFLFRAVDPTGGAPAGGAGGVQALKRAIESVLQEENRKTIAIFDHDAEGLNAFNSLSKNFSRWQGQEDVKVHVNELAFALLLPIPPGRELYAQNRNLSIEFLFPDSALGTKTPNGGRLVFETPPPILQVGNARFPVDPDKTQLGFQFDSCRRIVKGKDVFADEIVPMLDTQDFRAFEPLFQILEQIINQ